MTGEEALALWQRVHHFTVESLPLIDLSKLEPLYAIFPPSECACDDIGKCCRSNLLFLSSYEWHNVVNYVEANFSPEQKTALLADWLDYSGRFVKDGAGRIGLRCSFLDDDGRACKVHPARPMPCRAYGGIEGSCMDCKRDKSVPFKDFSANVRAMEDLSAKMLTTEGNKVPLSLPLEIWMRVATLGLADAMAEFYQSPWFEETRRATSPFGRIQ